jgi:hypothetical protein
MAYRSRALKYFLATKELKEILGSVAHKSRQSTTRGILFTLETQVAMGKIDHGEHVTIKMSSVNLLRKSFVATDKLHFTCLSMDKKSKEYLYRTLRHAFSLMGPELAGKAVSQEITETSKPFSLRIETNRPHRSAATLTLGG